ncbi:MAG: DUF459 domain-containing protein [Opitutae bacterium]|nr:DUF459 domain-containing protein [Opitutae bacterium]
MNTTESKRNPGGTLKRWRAGRAVVACLWAVGAAAASPGATSPVLLIGDSMMRLPARALERELAKTPGIDVATFSGIGTGLARLDAFDWLAKIDELCAERRPKVAVVALGANDRQPMMLEGLGLVHPGTPEWDAEYSARVGRAMDRLLAGGCEKIVWLQLPPMREAVVAEFAGRINAIVAAQAALRPAVVAHDFSALVADRRTGGFTERRMDPLTAAAIPVRDVDGIHLAPDGARLLAAALIKEYWK